MGEKSDIEDHPAFDIPNGYSEWPEDAKREYRKMSIHSMNKSEKRAAIANHFDHELGSNGNLMNETLVEIITVLYYD